MQEDAAAHTAQCKQTHTHEITELSFCANRKKTEVERERSHWNGRTNYKVCFYMWEEKNVIPTTAQAEE